MREKVRGERLQWAEELDQRQRNLLPPDLISNGGSVDDIFWNGPKGKSKIQRAGMAVFGSALLLISFAFVLMGLDQHLYSAFLFAVLIAAVGIRVIYKSFSNRGIRHRQR
jgi:hypothetical protein